MTSSKAESRPKFRLAVIVTDVAHLVNAGGEAMTTVKLFDMPPEVMDYIASLPSDYVTYRLAVEHV